MKRSPYMQKLEEMLRSSRIVAGGFMGDDPRRVEEIIDSDAAEVARLGLTPEMIADRMQEITDTAIEKLGNWTEIGPKLLARVDEAKGTMVCPWPEPGRYAKRVTYVRNQQTGREIHWSDLNIHMIRKHGFFEGKGSDFRQEPATLADMLFER